MKNEDLKATREIFADGVESIHMINGIVRLDLHTLQPQEDNGQPIPRISDRIIIPMQGFVQLYETMEKVIGKLVQDGVLKQGNKETNNWDIQK